MSGKKSHNFFLYSLTPLQTSVMLLYFGGAQAIIGFAAISTLMPMEPKFHWLA
jgi:hypothetical protein